MANTIIQALYFFLPGYVANAVPVILARFKVLEFLNIPVDANKKLGGEPVFGKTKTWRGIIAGAIFGLIIASLQTVIYQQFPGSHFLNLFPYEFPFMLLLGFLQGLGVGLGDLLKSFFKRRMHVPSTAPFIPFDQLDFIGGLILCLPVYQIPPAHLLVLLLVSPLLPVISNLTAYKLGWKKVPW